LRKQIQQFVERVTQRVVVDRVILFGSYAYGRPHRWSDVDIVVLSPDFADWGTVRRLVFLEQVAWDSDANWIEPLGYTPEEYTSASAPSLLGEVRERGVVVYDAAAESQPAPAA